MSNYLEPVVVAALRDLYRKGIGVREAARRLEIASGTVERYYRKFFFANVIEVPLCACGRLMRHRGMCMPRRKRRGYIPRMRSGGQEMSGILSFGA